MFTTCDVCGEMGTGEPRGVVEFAQQHTLDTGHTTRVSAVFTETLGQRVKAANPDLKQQDCGWMGSGA